MVKQNIILVKIIAGLLLICFLVTGCGDKASYHDRKGLALYNQRKYDESITEFKKALEVNPNHYNARFDLGIVYYTKGMVNESIAELKKAIDANPDEPKAHYNIAFAYVANKKFEDAISEYQKAIDLFAAKKDRKEAEGYLYLAITYSLIEKNEEAFIACKKALEINPNLEDGHYFMGVCYFKKNMFDDSIAELKKAVQLNPKSEKAHSVLSVIYDKLGMVNEVMEQNRILRQLSFERENDERYSKK
ncbi:MAG: tetratricopeptide repeat protein [Candidatus Jettenia sp. CY-1]|nr:tetratricopeptide repeat protein [Candidatus Jettenia sp.]WKZ17720.1 MAG: tetratricopeptide repeat protein [Candidatus Jettenia sp. CY-1]